jgi:hypothetical protein
MNTVFFNHIDRSESLEEFINDKTSHLHEDSHLRWVVSKEGKHDFSLKCIDKGQAFTEKGRDLYFLVSHIVDRMKAKHSKSA